MATGGEKTVMVTVAVELPAKFVRTYLNVSLPVNPVAGLYEKWPSAKRVMVPPPAVAVAVPIEVCSVPLGDP